MIYFIVYQITNTVNNKIYVGAHQTSDLNDGYMGSSRLLKLAIKKHGIQNFSKKIIACYNEPSSMFEKEAEIVTPEFCARSDTYNIKPGGHGGWSHINSNRDKYLLIPAEKKQEAIKKRLETIRKRQVSFASQTYKSPFADPVRQEEMRNRARSDSAKQKRKTTFQSIQHAKGEKNSQYGTCWIWHECIGNRKCPKSLLHEYVEQGWVKGRII